MVWKLNVSVFLFFATICPELQAQNPAACLTTDVSSIHAIDQEIQNAGSAPPTAASLQAYQALETRRKQLLAQRAADCAAACKQDTAGEEAFQKQLQTLIGQKNDPLNTGSASIIYEQQVKTLQSELNGMSILAKSVCDPAPLGLPLDAGQIRPSYMILFVVYAPPGANGGTMNQGVGASSVDYGSGSTMGSSVSTSNSYSNSLNITTTFSGGAFGDDTSLGVGVTFAGDKTKTNQIDVTKSEKGDIKIPGPGADGINHDYDRIYLWLNPLFNLTQNQQGTYQSLLPDGPAMTIQYADVGWLKNPSTMPPGLLSQFAQAGIQPSDYATILSADPFASGAGTIDPSRFIELSETYPYEPPMEATDLPAFQTLTLSNETKNTSTTAVSTSNGVDITVSAKI